MVLSVTEIFTALYPLISFAVFIPFKSFSNIMLHWTQSLKQCHQQKRLARFRAAVAPIATSLLRLARFRAAEAPIATSLLRLARFRAAEAPIATSLLRLARFRAAEAPIATSLLQFSRSRAAPFRPLLGCKYLSGSSPIGFSVFLYLCFQAPLTIRRVFSRQSCVKV